MELFKEHISPASDRPSAALPRMLVCEGCGREMIEPLVRVNKSNCVFCGHLFRMPAKSRIEAIADTDTFIEIGGERCSTDPLHFPQYADKLETAKKNAGLNEAIVTGICEINALKSGLAVMDSHFMMGSMGEIVGDKICELIDRCISERLPLIIFCASGGARMQEGMISLLQMTRTSIAVNRLGDAGLPFISVLTNPTTGGVTASFAMQGDVILAEPKALIGFAGPRVIQQTVKDVLPDEFQTAEYLYEKGMIDAIVRREDMKTALAQILRLHIRG